jgi:hypothetical protein
MKLMKRIKKNKRLFNVYNGQALVEFIMIVPIFLMTIFFGVQVCGIMKARSLLNVASYSAARRYAISQALPEAETVAKNYLGPFADYNMQIDINGSTEFGGTFITTVSIDYPLLPLPLMNQFFKVSGYKLPLSTSVPMIAE